jgi:hypothetical protein
LVASGQCARAGHSHRTHATDVSIKLIRTFSNGLEIL